MKPLLLISGIETIQQARLAIGKGASALGFVFFGERYINGETAREIALQLPPLVSRVGFFKDEPWYSVMEIASLCSLETLVFEGNEDAAYLNRFGNHHTLLYQRQVDEIAKESFKVVDIHSLCGEGDASRLVVRCAPDKAEINKALKVKPFAIEVRLTGQHKLSEIFNA